MSHIPVDCRTRHSCRATIDELFAPFSFGHKAALFGDDVKTGMAMAGHYRGCMHKRCSITTLILLRCKCNKPTSNIIPSYNSVRLAPTDFDTRQCDAVITGIVVLFVALALASQQ